jgi:hypothetical protein
MHNDFKFRDFKSDRDYDHRRTIKLYCHVLGCEEDYSESQVFREVKYSFIAHEDSIGTALNNLYKISLVIIEQALMEQDFTGPYEKLEDVRRIFDRDLGDEEQYGKEVESRAQIEELLRVKLANLRIGQEWEMYFDEVEVHFGVKRINPEQ